MASERVMNIQAVTLVFISFVLGSSEFIVLGISEDISIGIFGTTDRIADIVLLITLFAWAYAIAAPIITTTTSRMDRFKVFIALNLIFLAANVMSFVAPDYTILAISRILTAVVSGAILAMALAYSPIISVPENISKTIALIFAGFSISCTVGLPLGNLIAGYDWRYTFALVIILSAISIIMAVVFLPHHTGQGYVVNHDAQGSVFEILKDGRILLTMVFSITGVAGAYVVFSSLQPMMIHLFGFDGTMVMIGMLIFGVVALYSNLSSSIVADKGGYRLLRWIALIQVIVFVVMALVLEDWILGMITILLMGAVMYQMNSANQMHYMEIAGRDYPQSMGLASSFNPMTFNFGIGIGALINSVLVPSAEESMVSGYTTLAYVAAIVSLVAFVAVVLIVRIEKDPEERTKEYSGSL